MRVVISACVLLAGILCPVALAQSGAADPTLGGQGFVLIGVGTPLYANCVAVQADGKLVFCGRSRSSPNPEWVVGRCLDDGSLDPSFGNGGLVAVATSVTYAEATNLVIDPSGRIVVTGRDNGAFTVRRFLANGSLDATFGSGGTVVQAIEQTAQSHALAVVPVDGGQDHAIVVGGYCTPRNRPSRLALARFTSSGALDTAGFGDWADKRRTRRSGFVTFAPTSGSAYMLTHGQMGVAPDGKFVLLSLEGNVIDSRWVVTRFSSDGQVDTGFGTGGVVVDDLEAGMQSRQPRGCAVQPDGKILLIGRGRDASGFIGSVVVRLMANGNRDASFGSGGLARTAQPYENQPGGTVGLRQDGRIAFASTAVLGSSVYATSFQLLPDGSLDPTYGLNGVGTMLGLPGSQSVPWQATLDPYGRLLCAGHTDNPASYLIGRWLP